MRYWSILVLSFILVASAYGNEALDIIQKAQTHISNGEVHKGKVVLESALHAGNLADEEKALITNKLGWFYEELVGNYQHAERYSRNVLHLSLPASHRAIIEARRRIERLEAHESKYRQEKIIIRKMQMEASDRTDAQNKINELKRLIKNSPDYPDLPVVYHYIGKHYLYLESYYTSYTILSKVLKKRPGIIYLLPTESLMSKAKSRWYYFLVTTISKSIVMLMCIILFILLSLSKFWEWMNLRFLLILPLGMILWGLFLLCSSWIFNFFIPHQNHLYMEAPWFIQSSPFSPGSFILVKIFFYGVVGICGSFLLMLATHRFKGSRIKGTINGTLLLLFMSSLFTLFYLNHCHTQGIFEKRANSILPTVTGHTYFQERDYEPLILSNPRKYPNLTLRNTNDTMLVEWIKKQYAIIASHSNENNPIKK
ncbi:MAG: hypothetical protein ACMUIP_07935 [bacterium]